MSPRTRRVLRATPPAIRCGAPARAVAVVAAALGLAACGSSGTSTQTGAATTATAAPTTATVASSSTTSMPEKPSGSSSSTSVASTPPTTGGPGTTAGLPPPSPAIPDGPNTVFILGDSVILGAEANLPGALKGWDVTFDAKESRFIFKGLDELKSKVAEAKKKHDDDRAQAEQSARDAGQPPPARTPDPTPASAIGRVVVIHLCTNYEATGAFAGWIDQYMNYLKDVDRVVWVTCVEWSKGQVEANKAMHAAASKYPNYVVADWAPFARTPGYAYADGIHLQGPGRQALAEVVARAVGPAPAPASSSSTTSTGRR